MTPINTKETTDVLKAAPGTEDHVSDLPIRRDTNFNIVSSCWALTWRERLHVLLSGRVWFHCFGATHPPIKLTRGPDFEN